jgi:CDP-archaeol synthase
MLVWTYQLLFFGSPLLLAALGHGICLKYDLLRFLKKPLDFRLSFRGKRLLGENKTWRGLAIQIICCTLGGVIQGWLQKQGFIPHWLPFLDYTELGPLIGLLLGLGMTLGELPNSFLKRQFDIPPGQRKRGIAGALFLVLDQVDLTLGIWFFFFLLVNPALLLVVWSLVLTLVLHLSVSSLGYILRMRKTPS